MQCPRCSHENPSGARFCNACGTNLEAGTAPTSPAADTSQVDFLQRYIPQALADKMRQLGGQVESERRHVTVVFADISGFTAMSEKLDPEEVTHIINACFKTLVEVIFKYEGTIDKFIGDEIMALFGAPIAHENDPERAIRAALEMQARLRDFNANLKTPLPKPLTLHVGINSGEVIAGNVGSDLRMDYSVLGDTVNLAARLESVSVSGQILVSERTHALTRHLFEFKKLKPFKVQGKQKKVQTYEVAGLKAIPERGRGVQAGYGPLVGRQEELTQLRQMAERVRQGQGQVVGLVGDAGIGKSRLVYELQQLVPGFTQVSGACVSYEVPASYQVFTDVLGSLLSLAPDDDEFVQRRKLEAWAIARDLDEEHLPFLGSLFGLRDERLVYLQDEERYQQVQDTVLEVLRILSSPQPLLLVLEDLHWVDPPSRRLLEGLVAGVGALPVLICCAYRPEFQPAWKDQPACHILSVGPLPASETSQLAQGLLKLQLPPELEQLLIERTEGNPFFVEELLKALIDEGVIARTRTGFELKKDVRTVQLPDTIHGVILARLDRLEAQTRDTLQYASVIGRRFSQALLQAVSPRAQHIEEDLQQLQGLDLVYQHSLLPDLEFIFKHFVTREVAYNNVLGKRRKAIHLEVARSIEKIYKDRLEDYYEALAHHFEAGEDWQKAAEYYKQAGSKARELHADEGADVFLGRYEQARQKLFEQKERFGKRGFHVVLGFGVFFSLCMVGIGRLVEDNRAIGFGGFMLGALVLSILHSSRRQVYVNSISIFSDQVVFTARKDAVIIPFVDIASIHHPPERVSLRETFRWLRLTINAKSLMGSGSVLSLLMHSFRDAFLLTTHGNMRYVVYSTKVNAVLRELRTAVIKRSELNQIPPTLPVFERGFQSSYCSAHQLIVRREDGTYLSPLAYEAVIEKIRGGEILPSDFVSIDGQHWVPLSEAKRQDFRICESLSPVITSLRSGIQNIPFMMLPGTILASVILIVPWVTALLVNFSMAIGMVVCFMSKGVLNWAERLGPLKRRLMRVAVFAALPCVLVSLLVLPIVLTDQANPATKGPVGEAPKAFALPIENIHIDGQLDDWPGNLAEYRIRTNSNPYGPTDLDSTDLSSSTDFCPHFVVGYNLAEQLVYLGVLVRDDSLVLGSSFTDTDACEVYVAGNRTKDERGFGERRFGSYAALQYVAIPGKGSYGAGHDGGPSLRGEDIKKSGTRMAYSRRGDITTYEWAIQVFDQFPESPTHLATGKTIGFDVVAIDKDATDQNPAWVCWGPPGKRKFYHPELLGELILVGKAEDIPASIALPPERQ